jgi:hypothetical protein
MAVTVEMQNTGSRRDCAEIVAMVEHVFFDRPGEWRVFIVGSLANDRWELNIQGPNAFERRYILESSAGEHRAEVIRLLLEQLLPAKQV